MAARKTAFRTVKLSLKDLLGRAYVSAACRARAFVTGERVESLMALASEKVDLYPRAFQKRLGGLLPNVGVRVTRAVGRSARGATSRKFQEASKTASAPLTGFGYYRVAEDGRLYLISKSEHYHASVGHGFPGYRLLEHAGGLGIPNATHNNTRGHVTRLLEEELVRTANGIPRGDRRALGRAVSSHSSTVLNRVINLETGSLAVEAALKMILARFYRVEQDSPEPEYAGRVPVFLVVGSDDGDLQANYHGTTTLTQTFRGMWPDLLTALRKPGIMQVRSVRPDRLEDLDAAFAVCEKKPLKVAGFFHEFIMMNYGARKLTKKFIRHAYSLCRRHDVPTVADEIQSCLWAPGLFSFREYRVRPTFVALGKGFPGGQYPASKILFSARMDCLPQFGALVTNGQEELASLCYLITMRWAEENEDVVRAVGDSYQERLRELAAAFPEVIDGIDGDRHLGAIVFNDVERAKAFVGKLNRGGIDISVQTYKADCPPVALTKLPVIADYEVVDFLVGRMKEALLDLNG